MGLLYDGAARAAACALTSRWSFAELLDFQGAVARQALRAPRALELARELVAIGKAGLRSDREMLDPLDEIVATGRTPAERALEAFQQGPESLIRFWQIA